MRNRVCVKKAATRDGFPVFLEKLLFLILLDRIEHGSFLIVEIGKKDKEPQLNIEVNGTAMVLIIITFGPTTNNIHQKPKHGPLH